MASVRLDYFYGNEVRMCGFYRVPKAFELDERYKNASLEVKYLYCLMLDRVGWSTRNGWLDSGRVFIYFTLADVTRSINAGKNKAIRVMREMEALGLILRKKQGQGRPTRIFVRNFIESDVPPVTEPISVHTTDAGSSRYDNAGSFHYETDGASAPIEESGSDVPFYTRSVKSADDEETPTPDELDGIAFPSEKDEFSGVKFDSPADDDFCPDNSGVRNHNADGKPADARIYDFVGIPAAEPFDAVHMDDIPADNRAKNDSVDGAYDDAWMYDFARVPAVGPDAPRVPASPAMDAGFITDSPAPETGFEDVFNRSFRDERAFDAQTIPVRTSDLETPGGFKTELSDFPFWNPNKNNKNHNNDFINIESFYPARKFDFDGDSGAERRLDTMDQNGWKKQIKENIDYDLLSREHPEDMGRIDSFVEIMARTCASGLPTVRINREDMSRDEVRERFDELNQFHILYVLECMEKNRTHIRNIRAYILSALFNAPTTMDAYYDARVSRDMRRDW